MTGWIALACAMSGLVVGLAAGWLAAQWERPRAVSGGKPAEWPGHLRVRGGRAVVEITEKPGATRTIA